MTCQMRQSQIFCNGRACSTRCLSHQYMCHPKAACAFCPRTRGNATAFRGPFDRKSSSAHGCWKALSSHIFSADYLQCRKPGKKMFHVLLCWEELLVCRALNSSLRCWSITVKDSYLRSRIFLLPLSVFRIFTFMLPLSQLMAKKFQFLMSRTHQCRASQPDRLWT